MMRVAMAVLVLVLLSPGVALAECQTITIMQGGRIQMCTVCTYPGGQTINCL